MAINTPLKVGDKIIEFGQVFRIFKIEKCKRENGETDRIIYFRPFFKKGSDRSMVCSIPESSIGQTNIRSPISKEKVAELMKKLSEEPDPDYCCDVNEAKEVLSLNDPYETATVLVSLCAERDRVDGVFPKSKRDIINSAILRLVEEVALVLGTNIEKAGEEITKAFKK